MQDQEKSKVRKGISVSIIFILIVTVCVLFYQNTQNKIQVENKLNELKNEMDELREKEEILENEIANQHGIKEEINNLVETNEISVDEGSEDVEENNVTTGKLKEFKFNTPVGDNGKFEIYAEKAVQATGFSGASAHIYYLREGELYYHNQGDNDTKLATGITDLKQQGEDIIAIKGENTIIYVENQYIQYQ